MGPAWNLTCVIPSLPYCGSDTETMVHVNNVQEEFLINAASSESESKHLASRTSNENVVKEFSPKP